MGIQYFITNAYTLFRCRSNYFGPPHPHPHCLLFQSPDTPVHFPISQKTKDLESVKPLCAHIEIVITLFSVDFSSFWGAQLGAMKYF